jgi:quercetin dioxygenase-like cupin family protein
MKVVRVGDSPENPATAPLFIGTVHSRPLIDRETSPAVTVNLVRFTDGARNKRHTHTADQILYITEGQGIVASEAAEHTVTAGDIVHITAGEVHWHGAAPGASMAHLSILPPCETQAVE